MLVQDFLHQSAARRPNHTALVCGPRRWTYAEIAAMSCRLGQALIQRGVARGDRVAVYLDNRVETVVALFGILDAGATFVLVNRSTKADKLAYVLNNCRAVALITDDRALAQTPAETLRSRIPSLQVLGVCAAESAGDSAAPTGEVRFEELLAEGKPERPPRRSIDRDLACLIYTSGTTGDPKGVMSDHDNVTFAADSIISYLGNTESDIVLNVLPLSFDYGLYQLLMTFRFGGTLILENSFAYPASILALMQRERVTGLPGVPTLFAMLLRIDLSTYDLSALRYVTNTAAALPPSHILDLRRKFPQATLFSMYGLTETKRTLYLPPDWLDRKPGSVGIAIPGTEVWIEDDAGRRLGPNEVGELVVRGRHVMRGYWEAAEATAARYRPGRVPGERFCYTGDLFRMDEDGCMYFVARKDDIIKSRGEKVAPKEVETILHALDGVAEAAVLGVPDPILGQAIKAVVVRARPDLTARDVLAHCRSHLEDFMVPKIVEFRDVLPKSPSGKVRKEELI